MKDASIYSNFLALLKTLPFFFLLVLCLGAKNPFEPLITSEGRLTESISPEHINPEQIHLKAVIWNTEKKMALFETDDGKTFIAKMGTKVGKKGGKVSRIDDNMVVISGPEGDATFKIKD